MSSEQVEQTKEAREYETDFVKVAESESFKYLMQRKKRFIVPLTIFFLIFYFLLPILTSYSNILEVPAIGDISWAWIFAIAQFVMTWTLCTLYVRKASSFDEQAKEIIDKHIKQPDREVI
ncbi:DUF485 domain-containing protein [Candidatus Pseudothioglobus singularis]|nr:DUF485 domain-containing protein [Candidatus Pseudothioglobus singularis]